MASQVPLRIRLADPRAGYLAYKPEIDAAVKSVLENGNYILGPAVELFEKEFAQFIGAGAVVSTANGTDAIELSLRAHGIGGGDLVVTTSNTAVATVAAIELAGATVLLVDVDEATLTISPRHLEQAVRGAPGNAVKAVVVVHLYGQPADLETVLELCRQYNVVLIEDCAQAHGATVNGRTVGTWGAAGAFSFYPTKNLGAIGDGGAIATNNVPLANRLRELRIYGWKERYVSDQPGMNTRLDSLQAAILCVKLRHLGNENERRARIAAHYDKVLTGLELTLPIRQPGRNHVFHQYVIRTAYRDGLREHLRSRGVDAGVLYPVPVHQQPAYRGRILTASDLTITERAARELLCLPVHPWLSDADVEDVAEGVRSFFRR